MNPCCPHCAKPFDQVYRWPATVYDNCDFCGKWFTCDRQPDHTYAVKMADPYPTHNPFDEE